MIETDIKNSVELTDELLYKLLAMRGDFYLIKSSLKGAKASISFPSSRHFTP